MEENGSKIIPELLLSGYPTKASVVNFYIPLLKEVGMFYPDLIAAVQILEASL